MQNKGSLTQIINHLSRYIIRNALKSRVRMIHKKLDQTKSVIYVTWTG